MTDNGNYGERSHRTVNPLFLLGSDAPQEKTGTDVEGVEVGEFGNKKTTGKIRSTDWLIPSPAVNNVRTEGTDLKSEEGADPNITPPSTPPVPPKSHVVPPARKHRTINPLLIAGGEKPHNVETVEHVLKPFRSRVSVFPIPPDDKIMVWGDHHVKHIYTSFHMVNSILFPIHPRVHFLIMVPYSFPTQLFPRVHSDGMLNITCDSAPQKRVFVSHIHPTS